MTITAPAISTRAQAIAQGLIRSKRADRRGVYDQGMLRLERLEGGYFWIALNGGRLLKGKSLVDADEMQPGFAEAMEVEGR